MNMFGAWAFGQNSENELIHLYQEKGAEQFQLLYIHHTYILLLTV